MSIPFLTSLDIKLNELQNAKLHLLATEPTGYEGLVYFNTATKRFLGHNGTAWIHLDTPTYVHPSHTGDVTGSAALTISADAVTNSKLANMATSTIKGRATASTGDPEDLTPAQVRTMLNIADGANNYSHPAYTARNINTNTNQVIDVLTVDASGHVSNITTRDLTIADFGYTMQTTLTNSDSAIPTSGAVFDYVAAAFSANDAMIYKGVIDCSTNPIYPMGESGHTYKVSVAGKIGGEYGPSVEFGDMIICTVDATDSGGHNIVGANWTIVQVNTDGTVIGPASSVNNRFAAFDGTSGKLIKDSGYSYSSFSLSIHTHDFADISSKPTTLAGYGITDAALSTHNHTLDALSNTTITSNSAGEILKWSGTAWVNNTLAEAGISAVGHTHAFADLTSKPTTLAGYGITDASLSTHVHTFASLTSKPTTLAGYGITDAATSTHNHTLDSLSNTTITSVADGELLVWDTATSKWINQTLAEAEISSTSHTHAQLHDRSHAITSTSDHTAGNWKVLYSNGSGQIVELALGTAGYVLQANGAAAAPTFVQPVQPATATPLANAGSVGSVGTATKYAREDHVHPISSRKYAADVPALTAPVFNHDFGTEDVVVSVFNKATKEVIYCDVEYTSTTMVTLRFAVAPAASAYRVVIIG